MKAILILALVACATANPLFERFGHLFEREELARFKDAFMVQTTTQGISPWEEVGEPEIREVIEEDMSKPEHMPRGEILEKLAQLLETTTQGISPGETVIEDDEIVVEDMGLPEFAPRVREIFQRISPAEDMNKPEHMPEEISSRREIIFAKLQQMLDERKAK